ncbi:MAG: PIN domain-containing protein [Candidatus Woesearchaeota archaeon]|nr:PIN domain-containing protein [Candidatus Woesearchaeota archaeon]
MKYVVDANIVLSGLKAGNITELLLSPHIELIAPDLFFTELENNRAEIQRKSSFSPQEFNLLTETLKQKIQAIPFEAFRSTFHLAEKLLCDHPKDIPYVALALQFNIPFWTYEERFKRMNPLVVITTKEVRKKLQRE